MAKQDEPQAPESAADVIKNAQSELGKTRDLADAPVTPELVDASNRLVEAANAARTIAQAEYPFMVYDQEGKQSPRTVNSVEEYNAAIDAGFGDTPARATVHGLGDETEQQRIQADARREAEKEVAKERAKDELRENNEQSRGAKGGKK